MRAACIRGAQEEADCAEQSVQSQVIHIAQGCRRMALLHSQLGLQAVLPKCSPPGFGVSGVAEGASQKGKECEQHLKATVPETKIDTKMAVLVAAPPAGRMPINMESSTLPTRPPIAHLAIGGISHGNAAISRKDGHHFVNST